MDFSFFCQRRMRSAAREESGECSVSSRRVLRSVRVPISFTDVKEKGLNNRYFILS